MPGLFPLLVVVAAYGRGLIGLLAVYDPDSPYFRTIGGIELTFWIGLVFVTMLGMAGYDFRAAGPFGPTQPLPPEPWWEIALHGTNMVQLLAMGTDRQARRARRLLALRDAARHARQASRAHNPLGLGPSA